MRHSVSRRRFIAGMAALPSIKATWAFAASPNAADFDDPFLGQTTHGDLILSPQKTLPAAMLPAKPDFFGIVRKTSVIGNEQDAGKINLVALYAAFRDADCRVSLCSLSTLSMSTALPAQRACEALRAIAQRLKGRPDSVYALQNVDELTRVSCVKSGSRSVIVRQGTQPSTRMES